MALNLDAEFLQRRPANFRRRGERPCAFVELSLISRRRFEQEMLDFCRARLAKFKLPDRVIFGPIERRVTFKVQKFRLRPFVQRSEEGAG